MWYILHVQSIIGMLYGSNSGMDLGVLCLEGSQLH